MVRATGRRVERRENGARWLGLKVHARNITLNADLEMHRLPNGYMGLSRLPGDQVNVCGLVRLPTSQSRNSQTENPRAARENIPGLAGGGGSPLALLLGEPGSALHNRLLQAEFDKDSLCAVAGFSLEPRQARARDECCIGDALTMIPPLTGNGMSMAFEGAALAVAPLAAYAAGEMSWTAARRAVARACDRAFGSRLAWARSLQRLALAAALRGALGKLVLNSSCYWHLMFARTR